MWSFKDRVTISLALEESMIQRIDRWRFVNRIPSRSEAIRILIGRGFELGKPPAPAKKNNKPAAKRDARK